MKRILALVLGLLMVGMAALAELPDVSTLTEEETTELMGILAENCGAAAMNDLLADLLSGYTDEELAQLAQITADEQAARGVSAPVQTLQKGSKGDEVKKLQERLIELNYLSGSADGDYGGKTQSAVQAFQKAAGLNASGAADEATLAAVYADDAPVAEVYLPLDFKAISRDPDTYEGKCYEFSGKVLQVLEEKGDGFTYVDLRIATKKGYDDVVYVSYIRMDGEPRVLEDDKVTVRGKSNGLLSYTTVMGATVTLPSFIGETVTIQ